MSCVRIRDIKLHHAGSTRASNGPIECGLVLCAMPMAMLRRLCAPRQQAAAAQRPAHATATRKNSTWN
eukprot:3535526-Prymnesium_polylepis.1